MTFQHWAGVSSYTSSFDFAETCVFVKQLPGPIICDQLTLAPLLPKLRGYFAEFLNNISLVRLKILFLPTCVGLRYGRLYAPYILFSPPTLINSLLNFTIPCGTNFSSCSFNLYQCVIYNLIHICGAGIFYLLSIDYAFRPRLRSRLTLGGRTFPRNP